MNRINILNDVKTYLGRFTQEVRNHTASSTYDINIHAETVLIPLLNKVFGVNLKNYNSEQKNYPAIDLYDYEARLAIQVTSDSESKKISETISKFIEKKQYVTFDRLIVYIISEKQESYRKDFSELTKGHINFDVNRDIIDNADLSKIISDIININHVKEVNDLLMGEFSELKITERKVRLNSKEKIASEKLILNFIKFRPPQKLYFAITDINDEKLKEVVIQLRKEKILPYRRGGRHNIKGKDLVFAKLHNLGKELKEDFILFQDKLFTFRDLNNSNESLREIIDTGTIDNIDASDFYEVDENYLRKYKELLRNSIIPLLKEKGIEWVNDDRIFRFSAFGSSSVIPKERKVSWTKETKEQPRTVVFEMNNKEKAKKNEVILICFKHLAFFLEIEKYEEWYLSIRPTWSFTNPSGSYKSRFESKYLTGIKRQENNEAVNNHFLFISNCICTDLAKSDLNYTPSVPYKFDFIEPVTFQKFSPAIKDEDWLPRKSNDKNKSTNQILIDF